MTDEQIQIPFAGGPDESTDPTLVPPGSLISLRNANYDMDGQYAPRWGYTHLAAAAAGLTRIQRLHSSQDKLYAIDGTSLWNIDAEGAFENVDTVSAVGVTHSPQFNTSTSFQSWGEAAYNGLRIVAWVDPSRDGAQAMIVDVASGAIVMPSTTVIPYAAATAYNVQVGMVGSTAIVTCFNSIPVAGAYQISAVAISMVTAAVTAGPTVVSGADLEFIYNPGTQTGPPYAMCCLSDRFVIAYEATSSAGVTPVGITLKSYSAAISLDVSSTIITATLKSSSFQCMALRGATGEVVMLAASAAVTTLAGPNFWITVDPAALTLDVGPTVFGPDASLKFSGLPTRLAVERESAVHYLICASGFNSVSGQCATLFVRYTTAGAIIGKGNVAYNVCLASAPLFSSALGTSIGFVRTPYLTPNNTPWPGSYYLVDYQAGNVGFVQPTLLAILAPRLFNQQEFITGIQNQTPLLVAETATTFGVVMPVVRGGLGRNGLESFVVDLGAGYRWSKAYVGRETYFSGQYFDGNRVVETGPVWNPYIISATSVAGTGHTYQYAVTYASIDAQGNMEESAPFFSAIVTSGASPDVNVVVPCVGLSRKDRLGAGNARNGGIFVNLYRSPDLAGGNSNLYLIGTYAASSANANVVNAENVTINDAGNTDASIEVNPILYTLSGELSHNCPETFTHVTQYANRIWGIGADQRSIWFSEQYSDGDLPAWNENNIITVDDAGEPLIALGSLYSFLAIFTAHKIYVMYGQGPAPSGANSDLTPPQQLPSPVGCIEPRSLVNTPLGLMFQSIRGIELLGADLSVQFIGLPVKITTATYPICTSAVLCEDSSTVRFTLTNSEAYPNSGAGLILVLDYRRSRWSMYSLTCDGNSGAQVNAPMQAGAWVPSLGYVAGHNDSVAAAFVDTENNAASSDPWLDYQTYFVALSAQTAWIKASDLQGWHKVRRIRALCNYYDAHALTMTIDYDYRVVGESHTYTSQTIASIVSGAWEQVRAIPAYGKGEAIRITLATSAPTAPQVLGSGRGCGFLGLAFEIKKKAGGYKNIGSASET
jgi:hypothetical protein